MMITHLTRKTLKRFYTSEDGSFSVEAIIWMPIFATLLAVIMNITMVFHTESRILRVVQDANRALSLGRLDDGAAVEAYIGTTLAYLDANLTITSTIDGGTVSTLVQTSAPELMPFNFMTSLFNSVNVGVYAQQIIEF